MSDVAPSRARVIAAFAAVYIIWGSTYLAIAIAIRTLPPFLMASARFLVAGALLFAWTAPRANRRPAAAEWRAALIIGALLLLGGNGAVVWAEQIIPSGVAALVVALTPCWIVLLAWLWHGDARPGGRTVIGLLLGFGGIALLLGPDALTGTGPVAPAGVIAVMLGSLSWAVGSLYSKRAPSPGGLLFTAMQMLCGGTLLLLLGLVLGEASDLRAGDVSAQSALALLYLIVFGSLIAYSAYLWLLRTVSPASVATYAYVNPIVAVMLGWALNGEPLNAGMALAAATIVIGVALITRK